MSESIVYTDRVAMVERTLFGYRTDRHGLDRIQNTISAVCGVVAVGAVATMLALTLVEVLMRTAFDSPIAWTVGFIENYLLPAAAFFGIVTAYRSGAHVAVVSLFDRQPETIRKALLVISYLVILIGLGAIAWFGTEATIYSADIGEGPVPGGADLLIPSAVMRAIVPTAVLLGFVVVALDLFRELSSSWSAAVTDYDGVQGDIEEALR